ncbi:RidA family protein [Deinococcus sp. KSM4-11]|uniref:RidA family protein n=1 Tax=Deinococcus sp. KSM4-11 TaxID=2568654 RepID=UPI0010A41C91|nr:RidA family protein [Deinococcus sp. KSM4-11]THF87946.1 RidA family protein [Deinococcus sp. KSM4-11]
MKITHLNPDTLMKSPAFSQAVSVDGAGRLLFVGGQNGTRPDGTMAGADIGAQSAQALLNVQEALKAGGAGWADVVKLTIFLVHGQDLQATFAAAQTAVPGMTPPRP